MTSRSAAVVAKAIVPGRPIPMANRVNAAMDGLYRSSLPTQTGRRMDGLGHFPGLAFQSTDGWLETFGAR